YALVQHQLADVDFDVLRDVAGQAFDFNLAANEFEHAALLFHTPRFTADGYRYRHLQHFVHRHATEVSVQQLMGDRLELKIIDQDARVGGAGQLQRDQRVLS